MNYVDIENWNRKNHYKYFKGLSYPQFSICANVDITEFYKFIKETGEPFFISMLYIAMKAVNDIKEFRYRIREDQVVEHDIIRPSFTTMTDEGVFSFCNAKYVLNFDEFKRATSELIEKTKKQGSIEDEPGKDDLVYVTSIPWVSFTNITHPIHMNPVDCIPRIAWGKFFEDNGKRKLPLSVQVHHALMDGAHVGEYFMRIQELLDAPEEYLK